MAGTYCPPGTKKGGKPAPKPPKAPKGGKK
jgi:hypothetical protein